MDYETLYDIQHIKSLLPHRYPFLLVDRVIELVEWKHIVCIKNVSANEPYFQGHFPDMPVMPGALILESMAQAAGILAKQSKDGIPPENYVYLVGATDFRWKRPVVPGDTMVVRIDFIKRRRPFWMVTGEVRVNGEIVCSGALSAAEGM